jgi:hypothetical protein
MSYEACLTAIRSAAGINFTDDELEQILGDILRRKEQAKARLGLADDEAGAHAARAAADAARMSAAIEQRNALANLKARIDRRARIERSAATLPAVGGGRDLVTAIQAEIHGINTPVRGGRFSAEAEWKTRAVQYIGGVTTELERAGLLSAAKGRALERDWAREMFELSKGADGKPGVTGSREALSIAKIFGRYQDLARDNLNRAGAWIGDYAGYITRTSHDADKIRRAGYADWRSGMAETLDRPRTFEGVEDPEKFMRGVYNALTTGVHLTEDFRGFKDPAFTGPGNLAKRLSQDRVLHFRDADAWLDYNERFGTGTPAEAVLRSLDRAARAEALMRRWGTNPRAEFAGDLQYLAEQNRDLEPAAVGRLQQAAHNLQTRFDYLDGTANMPANRLGAKISSAVRIWESMAKLGMVAFTHMSAGVTKAAELRYHGVGLLQGYGDFAASLLRGRGHGETRELADLLLAGTEGLNRDMIARFEPDDTVPGTLSKLSNSFFRWAGLTYLLNAQKTGAEFVMSRHLGRQVDREFAELPPESQRLLKLYDIAPAEWDTLRSAPDHKAIDGRVFLTPDAAHRAIGDLNAGARDQLALKLHALFNDIAERSVITPGIPERALFLGGARPGTLQGEALRFVAQFKTWPAAAVRQGLGREIYGGQGKAAAMAGVLHIALGSAITGYVIMSMKDLLKGRDPRSPVAPATWAAAMMQGGGIGILGDYLFGEYNRFGQNAAETLLGPVLGQGISSVLDLWNKLKENAERKITGEGKPLDVLPETFRTVLNNLPFANMFYSRLALDYLFLWQVQEAMSPGFLRRFERRVQQQNHQNFWLRPSEVPRQGTGAIHMPTLGEATGAALDHIARVAAMPAPPPSMMAAGVRPKGVQQGIGPPVNVARGGPGDLQIPGRVASAAPASPGRFIAPSV